MTRQASIVNALHGMAHVGQQALASAYGSQVSFFSQGSLGRMESLKNGGAPLPSYKNKPNFSKDERFSDPNTQKNFRIGPKTVGPSATTYHT